MIYTKVVFTSFLICFVSSIAIGQTISSKIVDKKTNEPIPYATIQVSENQGVITNKEGKFSLSLDNSLSKIDSIYISSMGYEKIGVAIKNATDSIIYIEPKAIELKGVFVSNKNLTADEIIDKVKERVSQNYNLELSKKQLFFRESEFNSIKKLDVKFKKSTIEELNKRFIDSLTSSIPRKSEYYTEVLCNFYGNYEKVKLHITKAAELYDKNNIGSMDDMSKKLEKIFKDNVKPNSYLKIKSGLFGTKIQVDSILAKDAEATTAKNEIDSLKKKKNTTDFLKYQKSRLKSILSSFFFNDDVKSNFLNKSGRYDFELIDYTYIDDNSVYVINFSPKRSEDFKGTLYINTEDFAVIRVDYKNVKLLKNFKLLGLMYQDNLYHNKIIFTKGKNNKYDLKYLESHRGNLFGFDRSLKVIEKNRFVKGKRKQNELSLGIDAIVNNTTKFEIIVFDSNPLTEIDYKNSAENKNIKPTYLSRYNPEFWKGYNIIEPNSAIRQFTTPYETE
ncbi:carboxypeptidase-like regulatory domain-containing protein [Aquimarina longa]|uniref:carboxypeptidase-like regulatory domain-containing protein n=1 Tax=Aquimarina longa TaxID=1080221 RepID=UPI0007865DF5|nr:carboxypeptidase-like regulatory domain-containing protein [Aquimarina longa]